LESIPQIELLIDSPATVKGQVVSLMAGCGFYPKMFEVGAHPNQWDLDLSKAQKQ
jgi:hypothetical protein